MESESKQLYRIDQIDWNAMWQKAREELVVHRNNPFSKEFWAKKAQIYDNGDYNEEKRLARMVSILNITKDMTVIDVGCGTGRMTVPLAKISKRVTAFDHSAPMLDKVRERAEREGVDNIDYVLMRWEDAIPGENLGRHDIVLSSHAMTFADVKTALLKMHDVATRAAFINWWAGPNAMGREQIWKEFFGEEYKGPPDYMYLLNILYQQKIYANTEIIFHEGKKYYETVDDAVAEWFQDYRLTEAQRKRVEDHLSRTMTKERGLWMACNPIQTALVWWYKDPRSYYFGHPISF
jgi:protein-L-isoaspartate O-methyltransferase